jgi:peptidoglycan-N-acetylglucosamine deacetylase
MNRRSFLATGAAATLARAGAFAWPQGRRAAVSLTFDDARLSQIDTGLALFDQIGVKATFYVSPKSMVKRLDGWKQMLKAGHEVGNHSMTHPCSGNYRISSPLEQLTLKQMEAELDDATAEIQKHLGVKPVSFAYPCGQKYIGSGEQARSYIPLVAKRFTSGRGYLDEAANLPEACDLAQLMGTGFDGMTFAQMKTQLDRASKDQRWIVFAGHEIGQSAHQTTDVAALKELAAYLKDPANGFWVDTVANIATHLRRARGLR